MRVRLRDGSTVFRQVTINVAAPAATATPVPPAPTATPAPAPDPLAGTRWNVVNYNNGQGIVTLIPGTSADLAFGADGQATGNAGCNSFFGPYRASGNSLSVGPLGSSSRLCPDPEGLMEQEAQFLRPCSPQLASASTATRWKYRMLPVRSSWSQADHNNEQHRHHVAGTFPEAPSFREGRFTKEKLFMNCHDVLALQQISGYPALTITLPTHRTSPDNQQDPIRLRNLVTQATDRLLGEFSKREIGPLLARLEDLVNDVNYRQTLDGLVLCANQDFGVKYYLPFTLPERVVVEETFLTRDLVFAMNRTPRYWVLVLSEQPTRLFEGTRDTLVEVQEGGFPMTHEGPGGATSLPGGFGVNVSAN